MNIRLRTYKFQYLYLVCPHYIITCNWSTCLDLFHGQSTALGFLFLNVFRYHSGSISVYGHMIFLNKVCTLHDCHQYLPIILNIIHPWSVGHLTCYLSSENILAQYQTKAHDIPYYLNNVCPLSIFTGIHQ